MSGLRMICKIYGGLVIRQNGREVRYVWDYDRDEPVREEELRNRERLAKSERAKWRRVMKEAQGGLF